MNIYNLISDNYSKLEHSIVSNYSKYDQQLQSNTTVLDWRIFYNISSIQLLVSGLNTTIADLNQIIKQQSNFIKNLTQFVDCTSNYGYSVINGSCVQVQCTVSGQQSINGICQCTNINSIVENGYCVCPANSVLVGSACICTNIGQTIQNGVCQCYTLGAFVSNNVCTCGVNGLNVSNSCKCPTGAMLIAEVCTCTNIYAIIQDNQCICPTNSSLIGNTCVCNIVIGQNMVNGTCQCPINQSAFGNSCQTSYTINNSETSFVCTQQIYIQKFDIQSITDQIINPSNFSSGFVFNTGTTIQDAYITVADNVYSTMYPLFESQYQFNNIKLIFGAQTMTSGSILSNNNQITINQFNMLSKSSCFITTNIYLNILQPSSNSTNIQNLLINLSFILSNGNITLINYMKGVINIINYQILGVYQSYNCIALISLITNTATINVTNINFMPDTFHAGNFSSYLFSSVSRSIVQCNNLAVMHGNNSKYQNLISQSSSNSYQIYFGGLITNQNITKVNINQLILSCYQNYSTQYIQFSGFLIGRAIGKENSITITNVCFQQIISSNGQQQYYLGTVGFNDGNLTLLQSQFQITGYLTNINIFGVIGYVSNQSVSEFNNIIVTLNTSSIRLGQTGAICGFNSALTTLFKNILVNSSNIQSNADNGGLVGVLQNTGALVQNVTVQYTNLTCFDFGAGGLFGYLKGSSLAIINTTINSIRVSSSRNYGVIIGMYVSGISLNIQNSKSIGNNYINNVQQVNCDSFTNIIDSVTQC
ncbi:Conserved_hypothetical protein [Hexamita inflata]|uniref:Uncharacterized protein n=1 Tax=Hexamita inflata TaxID=28002 RepID=A0AA86V4I1_9EUKA|nr:Conserved hypothetical protein [Hexamita inflata]